MNDENKAILALHLSRAISKKIWQNIFLGFPSEKAFLNTAPKDQHRFLKSLGVKKEFEGRDSLLKEVDEVISVSRKKSIFIFTKLDDSYPLRLRHIYDPPPVLYARGELEKMSLDWILAKKKFIGIVGTRNADPIALRVTENLSDELNEKGISVVSGLAIGIDAAAHEGAMRSGETKTMAVLGNGLDTVFPRQHAFLGKAILDRGGVLLSEHPPGTSPRKHHFPARNRIISGLSDAVLLMQSGKRSGANITMEYAIDQNKDLYVYQPAKEKEGYEGNVNYLNEGAFPLLSIHDLGKSFGDLKKIERTDSSLIAFLRTGPKSLSQLAESLFVSEQKVIQKLMPLILEGKVESLPGNHYFLKSTKASLGSNS